MPETITAVMARWAADLRYEDLGEGAIQEARRYLLDSLGCAFGGLRQEDCHIALGVLDEDRRNRRRDQPRHGQAH